MKRAWKIYLVIFAASILAHTGLILIKGIPLVKDFLTIYDPMAEGILEWVRGSGDFPQITELSELFHINYVFFVSAVYFLFGSGNYPALVIHQVILSSLSCLLVFCFLRRHYASEGVAVLFTVVTFLFFDNMFMTIAASPEALYRSIFVCAYLFLIHLYIKDSYGYFFTAGVILFFVLVFIRIDTIILFVPIYILGLRILRDKIKLKRPSLLFMSTATIFFIIMLSLVVKLNFFSHHLLQIDRQFYVEGIVVADLGDAGKIEPLEPETTLSVTYTFQRGLKLFVLRAYQFLNVFPPSWSSGHQFYYASHMFIFYFLAFWGIVNTWKSNSIFFFLIILFYVSSIVLHGLTRVDAAHRTNYISLLFLIMLSGYGMDYLYKIYLKDQIKRCVFEIRNFLEGRKRSTK